MNEQKAPKTCGHVGRFTHGILCLTLLVGPAITGAMAQSETGSAISDEVREFCTNIADEARDQRHLMQQQELNALQAEIDARIVELEARTAEYQDWLERRDAFLQSAEAGLVDIYKGMRPDAAAEQLSQVTQEVAAAIVMKLNPRLAAQILNEMDATDAAGLASIIASSADATTSRDPS